VTVVVDHLTNGAYGFPRGHTRRVRPVALVCLHITGNRQTAGMADLHGAARAERAYANRPGSNGPSAHHYVARDGWAIEAIDPVRYAAWSNGDVDSPNTGNPGVVRVLAFRAKGYNVNEAYWLEVECVGHGPSGHPITPAQTQAVAELVAAQARRVNLPIDRETVHGHWEINGADRPTCPSPPVQHETLLHDVIVRARAILAPPRAHRVRIARNAIVRAYRLGPEGRDGLRCILKVDGRYGVDERWTGPTATFASDAPALRKTCDGRSGARTVRVRAGPYKNRHIRVGTRGVTMVQ
jgi:hypothetical protein